MAVAAILENEKTLGTRLIFLRNGIFFPMEVTLVVLFSFHVIRMVKNLFEKCFVLQLEFIQYWQAPGIGN